MYVKQNIAYYNVQIWSFRANNTKKKANEYIKSIDKFFESGQKYNKNYAKAYKKLEL